MYSWKKSPTEVATLRECFPTRVLLGSITDPLTPSRYALIQTKQVQKLQEVMVVKQGRKRPLDTPKRMIEREKEREKGRRRDIEREGEIRKRES